MYLLENISLALEGLKASKMRALLTMLGIIIGIGSVIAISTIGDSLTGTITESMSSLGANNITVMLQQTDNDFGSRNEVDEDDQITDDMLDSLLEAYRDEILGVSMSESVGSGKAQDGRLYNNVSITGANEGYTLATTIDLLDGRFISERDMQGSKNVAVVSDRLAINLFGSTEAALEQEVKIYTSDEILTFSVVGVYEYVDSGFGFMVAEEDISTTLYIPLTTAKKLNGSGNNYESLTVVASTNYDVDDVTSDVENFLKRYYQNNSKYTVRAMNMGSMLDTMTEMLGTVQLAISAIAAISLLVGGIGVMNIMLVSVTERTREIGTRKALGARDADIRIQFVVEAVIICLIGGVLGIVLGIGMGYVGANILGAAARASGTSIALAVGFSMLIGVFFGYYPASKAAKLDPIEALRYE